MGRRIEAIESPDQRVDALQRMVTIRAFENRVGDRFADGEIPGTVHLSLGQEAVAVGMAAALNDDDAITSTHRGHGHSIAMGLDPSYMMAELYGKEAGYCSGKGGSMHIADVSAGMLGANGIVGAGVPIGTGAALMSDLRGTDRAVVSIFGDGSVAQGQIHEGINLAAVWNLPIVFLLENNQYAEMRPSSEQLGARELVHIAEAYDIPGRTVDGMNVEAVYEAVSEARADAVADGPVLVEAETYRYAGHFQGDPLTYRDDEEFEEWRERDAIEMYKEKLVGADLLSADEFEKMREEAEARIDEAVEFARDADAPPSENAYEDVFAEQVPEIEDFRDRLEKDATRNERIVEDELMSRPSR